MMWWTAIIFGLLGSLHCMGMCGPIALAVPVGNASKYSRYLKFLIYNFGRVLSYSAFGLIFGSVGAGLSLAGFQQTISILAGVIIILSVILIYYLPRKNRLAKISSLIQKPFVHFFKKKTNFSVLMIGVLNGLLPCGLVYLALAGALAQGNTFYGMIYMTLFGLGTIPAFFALRISSDLISPTFRLKMKNYVPIFSLLIGCLFFIRGLGLGIPYLSPEFVKEKNENGMVIEKAECCSKSKNKNSKIVPDHIDCTREKTCH